MSTVGTHDVARAGRIDAVRADRTAPLKIKGAQEIWVGSLGDRRGRKIEAGWWQGVYHRRASIVGTGGPVLIMCGRIARFSVREQTLTVSKPGPRPTPTKLRVLKGETRPSRLNPNEPVIADGEIRPLLPLSDLAQLAWNAIVASLSGSRVLSPADAPLLGVLCEHYAMHHEMIWHLRALATKDAAFLVDGRHGNATDRVKNPLVAMIRQEATVVRSYGLEFGLTPSSRSVLVTPESPSELEKLLS